MSSTALKPGAARVGVVGLNGRPLPGLLACFGSAMGVQFEERGREQLGGLQGVILLGGAAAEAARLLEGGIPCLHFPLGEAPIEKTEQEIRFAERVEVPRVLRGRMLRNRLGGGPAAVAGPNATVLAQTGTAPLWTTRREAGSRLDSCLLPLPALGEGQGLFDYLTAHSFAQTLPLLEFLKFVSGDAEWQQPALRACFMFDDPNLHWPSYGCIDYRTLAEHANAHNYHVSFATIPLDCWLVHPGAARLFRDCANRLSLLVHGNNHTQYELARDYSAADRTALLRQALERIERLEARSGCRVSRVMAAPHGACSEAMMEAMAKIGFEAACISHGSLRHHNPGKPWRARVGLQMSEMVAGLPILPRFGLANNCHNAVLLCALLNQPIIAMGHHQDVAGGLESLGELAGFINSLGEVQWSDMQGIARANYRWRKDGDVLRVQMHSRRVQVVVPAGARELALEGGAQASMEGEEFRWRPLGVEGAVESKGRSNPSLNGETRLECFLSPREPNGSARGEAYPLPLWGLARRLLSEARDRSVALTIRVKQ